MTKPAIIIGQVGKYAKLSSSIQLLVPLQCDYVQVTVLHYITHLVYMVQFVTMPYFAGLVTSNYNGCMNFKANIYTNNLLLDA